MKVPFLIFWSDKPPPRPNITHKACSQAGTLAAWAEVERQRGVSSIVWNIHHSAKSDFLKNGHP